jgi:uncharacterized membrane protein
MGFWVLVALVVAGLALRRAIRIETLVRELRGEIVTLQARLTTLAQGAASGPAATPAVEPAITTSAAGVEGARVGAEAPATATTGEAAPVFFDATVETSPGSDSSSASAPFGPASEPGVGSDAPPLFFPPPVAASAPASATHDVESLERRIGSRWLLYLGVATLVLGISYFIKYAFDNEWIAPPVRVLLGIAGGISLVWAGQRFIARGLERYGQTLTGGGVGILYLAIYASYHWYGLIDRLPAFAAMVAITLAGVWLADAQRSQVLALFSVTIGFLTPAIIGGEQASQITLFTYDLLLVAGTLVLARRRDWPALNIVSYLLTAMTISAWAESSYRRSEHLTTELFLTAFVALFLLVLRENRKSASPLAPLGTVLLASAPVFYHLASLAVLAPHRGPLRIYLIAFSVAGVIAAQHLRSAWLRLAIWLAVAVPFLGFASTRLPRGWMVATWVTLAAIYGLHLIAQIQALEDERERVPAPEVALLHGNALWALTVMWLLLAPRAIDDLAPVAFTFAAVYAIAAFAARGWHRDASLHGAALAATIAGAACAMRFRAPWLSVALGIEGAALVWLGLRERRHWLRHVGSLFLSAGVALLLALLARPLSLGDWPFLNARAVSAAALVLILYVAAWETRRLASPAGSLAFAIGRLVIIANVLTILALSAEISAYYGWSAWEGRAGGGAGVWTSAELARQLTLSIVWAAYAVGLVAVGLRIDYRPLRVLAIALFAVTIGKVFLVDLAALDRVSRMFSVIGLGLLLLTASYLYQRLRVSEPAPVLPDGPPAVETPDP